MTLLQSLYQAEGEAKTSHAPVEQISQSGFTLDASQKRENFKPAATQMPNPQ
jgi:hypothetical protein